MTGFTLTDVLGSEVVCCKAGEAGNGFILGLKNKTTIFKTPDKKVAQLLDTTVNWISFAFFPIFFSQLLLNRSI